MASRPRILVVDDELVVRESLRDWFTQGGYLVDMAASAREALEKLRESSWDIMVTDIKMPGMDGLELQSKVKEIDPDIVIIIMTAYASLDTAVQAIREGAYDYVTKPLDPENLEQIVNRAAEHQQLRRENIELRERIEAIRGERAAVPAPNEVSAPGDLPPETEVRPSGLSLAEVEKQHIQGVLAQVSGDVSKAASSLQIDEATLREKMRRYGLGNAQA